MHFYILKEGKKICDILPCHKEREESFRIAFLIIKGEKEVCDFLLYHNEREENLCLFALNLCIYRQMTMMTHDDCVSTVGKFPIICPPKRHALRGFGKGFEACHSFIWLYRG